MKRFRKLAAGLSVAAAVTAGLMIPVVSAPPESASAMNVCKTVRSTVTDVQCLRLHYDAICTYYVYKKVCTRY